MKEFVQKKTIKQDIKKNYKIIRWIYFSLAILSNAFLILYSCLSMETTYKWNLFVTNIFSKLVNNATEKEVANIPITNLNVTLSSKEKYVYNDIPGYEDNEIPLGSAKQVEFSYLPQNTTDKSIEYYTEDNDIVKLDQNGSIVSVVGMKEGTAKIYGKNKLSGLTSFCEVKVVNTVEPKSFNISVKSTSIPLGSQQTIEFDIDGGCLGHNEIINFRYYDTRKLSFESSSESIFKVSSYGVIQPVSVGEATLTVSNHSGVSHSVNISVISGTPPSLYSNLEIYGSNICYDNDMIKDQSSNKNHYQLGVKNGETMLNPEDFVWESSQELLAKVDNHGVLRGFRKSKIEDESIMIYATSKITGQKVSFPVIVKEQIPESQEYYIKYGESNTWMPEVFTVCNGDNALVYIYLNPKVSISNNKIVIESSNENIIETTLQGNSISLRAKGIGDCDISFYPNTNSSLRKTIHFTILKAGAINKDNIGDVGYSLRKIIGHAFVFAVAQLFTYLAFYTFMYSKPIWLFSSLSFGTSIIVASISEIIELLIPGRSGTFVDVLIDLSGAFIVTAVFGLIFAIKHFKKIKTEKQKKANK